MRERRAALAEDEQSGPLDAAREARRRVEDALVECADEAALRAERQDDMDADPPALRDEPRRRRFRTQRRAPRKWRRPNAPA